MIKAATAPIRIMLVDDHPIVRIGLAALIGTLPGMETVAQAGNGQEAIALHREHHPDVTLMDLRLPDLSGVQVIREIRATSPEARFIVLTTYEGDEDIHPGAAGRSARLHHQGVAAQPARGRHQASAWGWPLSAAGGEGNPCQSHAELRFECPGTRDPDADRAGERATARSRTNSTWRRLRSRSGCRRSCCDWM